MTVFEFLDSNIVLYAWTRSTCGRSVARIFRRIGRESIRILRFRKRLKEAWLALGEIAAKVLVGTGGGDAPARRAVQ